MDQESNRTMLTFELHGPRDSDEPLVLEQLQHDDWEPGEPCAYCGAHHIRETHIQDEIARHRRGSTELAGSGDRTVTIEYTCDECERTLYRHPIASLAAYHPEEFEG